MCIFCTQTMLNMYQAVFRIRTQFTYDPLPTMARTKANVPKKHTVKTEDKQRLATADETPPSSCKKRRYRPGTVALREIRRYQRSTDFLVRRAPMKRLVRDIDASISPFPHRFKSKALDAIHTAAEAYLQELFRKSIAISLNGKSVTLKARDMACARHVMAK